MAEPTRRELAFAAWNGLKGATWPVRTRIEKRLRDAVPTPAQMRVLQMLLSDEGDAMTPRALASCMRVTPATISTTLNALEEAGLIERARESADRRVVHLRVTPKGREKVRRWRSGFSEELAAHFAPLTTKELQTLATILAKVAPARVDAEMTAGRRVRG
ncbi:MAG: MarR family winged helix-turn-helix transcriptional regulator [Thermoplasmatota archaeon]